MAARRMGKKGSYVLGLLSKFIGIVIGKIGVGTVGRFVCLVGKFGFVGVVEVEIKRIAEVARTKFVLFEKNVDSDIYADVGSIDALNVLSTVPFLQLSPESKVTVTNELSPVITPIVEGTTEVSPVIQPTVEGTTEVSPVIQPTTTAIVVANMQEEEEEAEASMKKKKESVIGTATGKRERVVKEKKEVDKKEKVAKRKGKKKLEDEDDMDNKEAVVKKKKAKGRGKKKVEEEEDEDEGSGKYFKSLRAKTTVKPFYNATHKLSPERKQRVREMGFGSFLDFPFDKIPTKLPYFILKNLNEKTMEVNLPNGGVIKITPKKIREVLGIPMGPIPFYAEKKRLTKDSEGVDFIFELSYLTLFANCFGSCKNTAMLKDDVLENVKSSEDIPNIDWCTLIWDYIKGSKEKWDDRTLENWYYGPHVTFTIESFGFRVYRSIGLRVMNELAGEVFKKEEAVFGMEAWVRERDKEG
ncbi:hypothetical protein CTI12_AA073610 [Artemisia annua]|uniref:Ulp1 protease family, C-terminal catalytic domain-containing protein n=1 Tax=Artemisia annua TaxID=35608 RepID=A0A2U1Q5C7_ARTAN|nr:hypothetical protein CTI12_AA073610 [Artemisia annua]